MHTAPYRLLVVTTILALVLNSLLPLFDFSAAHAASASVIQSNLEDTPKRARQSAVASSKSELGNSVARKTQPPLDTSKVEKVKAKSSSNVMFIENVGQFDPRAKFQVRGANGTMFLSDDAIWITMAEPIKAQSPRERLTSFHERNGQDETPRKGVNIKVSFVGAKNHPTLEPFDRVDNTHISYFLGNDKSKWRADVPIYRGVRYKDLYPGVDLELRSENGEWQPRLIAHEGANMDAVRLKVKGANKVTLDASRLQLATEIGNHSMPLLQVFDAKGNPLAQNATPTLLKDNEISAPFVQVGSRTSAPTAELSTGSTGLSYSTFLGGSDGDIGDDIVVDSTGAAFIVGNTYSTDFPTTAGSFQTTFAGTQDVFISKLNADGNGLIYSTYLGGDDYDCVFPCSIAIDESGNAYMVGTTDSNNFPTTDGAFQRTFGGNGDAFVAKLNATGADLLYSTFLGGNEWDGGRGIAVDSNGATYIIGATNSANFPTTLGAYDTSCGTDGACNPGAFGSLFSDAYVTKLNATGSGLIYSTFVGGSKSDGAHSIALGASETVFIGGVTGGADFPTTEGAYQRTLGNLQDGFVTKLDANGTSLVYSTYLGGGNGNDYEMVLGIAVDSDGAAYVTGVTTNSDFPTTPGAFQITCGGCPGNADSFVTTLDAVGSSLLYSTFFGGTDWEDGDKISVGADGSAYISGTTYSSDLPTASNAMQSAFGGGYKDAFVAKLIPSGNDALYASYLGGSSGECNTFCRHAIDTSNAVYVTGSTGSSDFPITAGAYQTTLLLSDAFITKLGIGVDTSSSLLPDSFVLNSELNCPLCFFKEALHLTGKSINFRTGGEDHTVTDLSFPALGGQMAFSRSYSSLATSLYTTTLGYGWTHSFDTRLILPNQPGGTAGQVLFKFRNANQFIFFDNSGTYTPYPGILASLVATTSPAGFQLTFKDQSVFLFDADGRVLTYRDPQDHTWTYAYTNGQLTRVEDSTGQRYLNFGYDAQGRLESVSDPISRTVHYGYNANGDLETVIDARSKTWTYHYDGATHRMTELVDPLGHTVMHIDYDAQGRAWRELDALSRPTVEIAYATTTGLDGTRVVTDGVGTVITATYDTRGTLTNLQDATGQTQKQYDANFRQKEIRDPNQNPPTQLTWSADGANLTQIVDARGSTTTLSYDGFNNLTRTVDALARASTFEYDGTLLRRSTNALNHSAIYTYTVEGLLQEVTDARGNTTHYTYTPFGQRETMTDALGNVTHYEYDGAGRLHKLTDPLGHVTRYEYDNADHLTKVTQNYRADKTQNEDNVYNLVTEHGYDDAGNRTTTTDTLGRITFNEYDENNRLKKVWRNYRPGFAQNYLDEYNILTQYDYDAQGHQTTVTDTHGRVTKSEYDYTGRLKKVIQNYRADKGQNEDNQYNLTTTYEYDAAGNVTQQTDTLGRKTVTEYDELNRPEKTIANYQDGMYDPSAPDRDLITLTTYDAVGNVETTTDVLGRVTFNEYDALNRLERVTVNYDSGQAQNAGNEYNIVTAYHYDAVGNRDIVTDTLGRETRTVYDALNRAVRVTQNYRADKSQNEDGEFNLITQYGYNAIGSRVAMTDTLNRVTRTDYDAANRVQFQYAPDPSIAPTEYRYDALGNRTDVIDPLGKVTHTAYDTLNRVKQVIQNYVFGGATDADTNVTTQYEYNALGNRIKTIDPRNYETVLGYDDLSRNITIRDANLHTTTIGYRCNSLSRGFATNFQNS